MSTYKSDDPYSLKTKNNIRDYIETINKAVQNVFNSLNPDSNFTEEELNKYNEIGPHIALAELTEDHFDTAFINRKTGIESEISVASDAVSMKVRTGDLVNQLNVEPDAINIKGNRIHIAMDNFVVSDTKMYARGNITATGGNIAGWTITSNSDGTYHTWSGSGNSKIDVSTIHADTGTAGTVNAYGSAILKATFKGNFDTIDVEGAQFQSLSCSCMQDTGGRTVYCGSMRVYKSYRDPYTEENPDVEHPDKDSDDFENYDELVQAHPNRYNINSLPDGGVMLNGEASCTKIYSSSAGQWWSDRRLKEDIKEVSLVDSLLLLETLKPCSFTFRDSGIENLGFIAQETPTFYQSKITKSDFYFTKKGISRPDRLKNDYIGLKYRSIACTLDAALVRMAERLKETSDGHKG